MHSLFIKAVLITATFLTFQSLHAQEWSPAKDDKVTSRSADRDIIPNKFDLYHLDIEDMRALLLGAPKGNVAHRGGSTINIKIPLPSGTIQVFAVKRTDVFHPNLAARYPEIQAYTGYNKANPKETVKLSMSHKGMDAMILNGNSGAVFIDRHSRADEEHYIVYYKSDLDKSEKHEFSCGVDHQDKVTHEHETHRYGDCTLRTYRLALACTGEYANFHGGTVEDVLAEYNTAMNRVNGIYERDAAITMQLIENTDTLIFFDAATDPYTNSSGGQMLGQNQSTIDQLIGLNNYDIGHVFSTGGGGIASLRSPCTNRRARGVTGLGSPINDPFYVDYVAHEMGHQFGGNHSYNNSCDNNRNNSTAVEPGSGATIMGYAGICSPNIQNNSDAYFHTVNLEEIADFVVAGNGGCAEETEIENTPPQIQSYTQDITLPSGTPFFLEAIATDEDTSDILTYSWEQMDIELAAMPPQANSNEGPAFRSFDPTVDTKRYFPAMERILNNNNLSTWEVLPAVDRTMDFRVTVRDNALVGGCTEFEDMVVTISEDAGPFVVNTPDGSEAWNAGSIQEITWDVAGTDVAPINCELVNIYLATGFDRKFDIILAEEVPNDGVHEITVPITSSSAARVMVQCATSSFFDVSPADFDIRPPYDIVLSPKNRTGCAGQDFNYDLIYTTNGDFQESTNLSLEGVPDGITASLSTSTVNEFTVIDLSLTDTENLTPAIYPIDIITTNPILDDTFTITLTIPTLENLQLENINPIDGIKNQNLVVDLSWDPVAGNQGYYLQVSDKADFSNLIVDEYLFPETYTLSGLLPSTVYYWRATTLSICFPDEFITTQSFQTGSLVCESWSTDEVIEITDSNENNLMSPIDANPMGQVSLINVSTQIDHSYPGDLSAYLISPDGQQRTVFARPGNPNTNGGCSRDNIDASFSEAASLTYEDFENTCEPGVDYAITGTFQPMESLIPLSEGTLEGTWILNVTDFITQDGGSLNSWALELCGLATLEDATLIRNEGLTLDNTATMNVTTANIEVASSMNEQTFYSMTGSPSYGNLQILDATAGGFIDIADGGQFTQDMLDGNNIRYQYQGTDQTADQILFDIVDDLGRWLRKVPFDIVISISQLSGSGSVTSPLLCNEGVDGAISLSGTGGTPPYSYSLDGEEYFNESVFSNLSAGSYTGYIRDANNDIITVDVTLSQPLPISTNFTVERSIATIIASGGTGMLTYSSDGENYQISNEFDLPNLTTNTLYVRDDNQCESEVSGIQIDYIESFISETTDVDCAGNATGSVTVTETTGGPEPYNYTLSGLSQNSNTFDNLIGGTYSLTVRDANDVEVTNSITIAEPNELEISVDTLGGMATVEVEGGTSPFTYLVSGLEETEENIFTDLATGTYTVTVTDANGCVIDTMFEIINNTVATVDLLEAKISLYPNPAKGEFYIINKGTYSFDKLTLNSVDGKTVLDIPFTDRVDISNIPPGMYVVSLRGNDITASMKVIKN